MNQLECLWVILPQLVEPRKKLSEEERFSTISINKTLRRIMISHYSFWKLTLLPLSQRNSQKQHNVTVCSPFGLRDLGRQTRLEDLDSGPKRIADVVVVSPDGKKCDGQLYGADPDLEFVAEDQRSDTCNGDSGGPAYLKTATGEWLLAGATSRPTINSTMPCGDGGIYVRTDKYVPWITQTAAANNISFP